MWRDASTWIAETGAVFAKEWRCELRTRYALNTLGLFAVTTLLLMGLALGPLGAASGAREAVLPALLWLILFFAAAAGLPRAFVHEEDRGTATALRMAATPSAVFCGKAAYAVALVLGLELVVTPLFLVMMQLSVASPWLLILGLGAGGFGLAIASTLIAAIVAQAEGQGTLFAVLAIPVLIPLLLLAVNLTRAAITGEANGVAVGQLLLYDGTLMVGALMLFPFVWNPS